MPESTPRSPCEASPTVRPRRAFAGDREGVSEVIGYLLVFGILSMLLVLSMLAFGVAQEAAQNRAVELRAESAAARVAGVVVQTALLAEQQGTTAAIAFRVDLDQELEGRDYLVRLEAEGDPSPCDRGTADADQVCIFIPSMDVGVSAPLFSAAAPTTLSICTTEVEGGVLDVRINAPAAGTSPVPIGCASNQLFLENP